MMRKEIIVTALLGIGTLTIPSVTSHAQLTAEHVSKIQQVNQSVISPDGKYIAYTLVTPADPLKENSGSQQHLYLYNVTTKTSTAFYSSSSVSQVSFRPGSNNLCFLSRAAGDKTNSLFEMSIFGGEAKKIYTHTSNISNYHWNDDGKKLAFVSAEKSSPAKTPLTYSPQFFEEEFNDSYVFVLNNLNDKAKKLNIKGAVYMAKWSPDASKLAVSVAPTSSVDDSYMAQKVKVVSTESGQELAHIEHQGKLAQITWSPDGKNIALLGAFDINDPTDGSISVVSSNGGTPKVINGNFQGKYEAIKWSDNKHINFLASEGTKASIGTISVDGAKQTYQYQTETANITTFDYNKSGQLVFVANTPSHPSELFILDAAKKQKQAQRLTESNPWLKDVKLGKQEVIKYKARDGKFDIEGMLIYPLNYKEGTKLPLITVVHGGPESHYSNGWLTNYSSPGQMGAAEGYAVFYPNYRGSTGRGVTFTYSSQADLAGAEFDDIVDGVDFIIEKGIADKARIGVTGGSYGGYASAWMSTYYSDRFAASVMFVGISNNISKFGTSDIPTEMKLVHERGNVWDNWEKQLKISPIYYADRAKTPILIMHGAEDPRVHPAQSLELYRHLKVRKPELPLRLIFYPGEGHGNARSGSRYDYNLRMMQWFNTYLKTGDSKATKPSLDLPVVK